MVETVFLRAWTHAQTGRPRVTPRGRALTVWLAGLVRPTKGSIRVADVAPPPNAAGFRHAGVAVIPADRQKRGLALPLSITEAVLGKGGGVGAKAAAAAAPEKR